MRKILLFLAFTAAAGAAQAQIKCWNEGGKRVCGDTPPPGAKVTTLRGSGSAEEPAPAPASKDAAGKDAKKGPLTPSEQEQEYRKRQIDSQKAAAKSADEKRIADNKRDNCARAREALAQLESGQRIMRVNPTTGERYFMEDAQIAQELVKARQVAQESCN